MQNPNSQAASFPPVAAATAVLPRRLPPEARHVLEQRHDEVLRNHLRLLLLWGWA
jgi:hypothetical protein